MLIYWLQGLVYAYILATLLGVLVSCWTVPSKPRTKFGLIEDTSHIVFLFFLAARIGVRVLFPRPVTKRMSWYVDPKLNMLRNMLMLLGVGLFASEYTLFAAGFVQDLQTELCILLVSVLLIPAGLWRLTLMGQKGVRGEEVLHGPNG